MRWLLEIERPVCVALAALFMLLVFMQTVYALMVAYRGRREHNRLFAAYEFMLVYVAVVACAAVTSPRTKGMPISLVFPFATIPVEWLMWVNVATLFLGVYLAVSHKKPGMIPELFVIASMTPPGVELLYDWMWLVMCVDACLGLFRSSVAIAFELHHHRTTLTLLSVGEAIKKLPGGILYLDSRGKILLMNDFMEDALVRLGIGGHIFEIANVWNELCASKKVVWNSGLERTHEGDFDQIAVKVDDDFYLSFERRDVEVNKKPAVQICAVDITASALTNAKLEETNEQIERVNDELSREIELFEQDAKRAAVANMQRRVHDNIGERMSIIHQFLESGNQDPEALQQVVGLVTNMKDSLSSFEDRRIDQLAALRDAFKIVGLTVHMNYETTLREEPEIYDLVASIIRESATNVLKHGDAKDLWVTISENEEEVCLELVNDLLDGNAQDRVPHEKGSGLFAMKEQIESQGGTFEISAGDKFVTKISIPLTGEA